MAGGEIAKGAAVGGFKGAAIGANPLLAAATGGLSIAAGAAIGGIAGGVKAKKSEDERSKGLQLPTLEDPNQTSRRLEVERIAKNIQAGTDSATQTALEEGAATTAGAQSRIARVTGGAGGATVDALLKSQRAGQQAGNQAIAQGQSRLPFFQNLAQQVGNRQEQRKLELQLLGRAQTSAETAQEGKERNVNSNALLASGLLGSNLEGQGGRINSLINQGIGKAQGDTQALPTTGVSPIANNVAPPDISTLTNPAAGTEAIPGLDPSAFSGIFGG